MTSILTLFLDSMYGHIKKMADQVVEGAKSEGCDVELYQVPETLSEDVLKLLHAPPKADDPILHFDAHNKLVEADAIIFGFPTRFGMMCAQMKAMFDSLGRKLFLVLSLHLFISLDLWQSGQLVGKLAGIFVSTGTQGGGQETTALTAITQLAHLGMIFVPTGWNILGITFHVL